MRRLVRYVLAMLLALLLAGVPVAAQEAGTPPAGAGVPQAPIEEAPPAWEALPPAPAVGAAPVWGGSPALTEPEVRVRDLARLEGVRENQLVGMGLVVGLEGTGDGRSAQANVQMVANMLARFGIRVDQSTLQLRNAAAVIVTAELPPFHRPGDRIDVVVSSFGDARSLQGGFLLQTPLQAGNGEVYAVAQGPVSIGGFNVRAGGAQVQRNHAVVGRIPGGAIVEREAPSVDFYGRDQLVWLLRQPDFTTASRVAEAVNDAFGAPLAVARDAAAVTVRVPSQFQFRPVEFIAAVEGLAVRPDSPARVVINERTGTVVMGHRVKIAAVAVAHGNLTVRIGQETVISQPPPFSRGDTVVVEQDVVDVEEGRGSMAVLSGGATVGEVVHALNAMGVSPRDMIAILQAMKVAGALYGELEII